MDADLFYSAFNSLGFAHSALYEAWKNADSLLVGRAEQLREMLDDITDLKRRLGGFREIDAVQKLILSLSK